MSHTMLIVDDEDSIREIMSLYFSGDYTVFTARNIREALTILSQNQIDLLITDICLGQDSGTKLYEQTNMYPSVKTLFMTGYVNFPLPSIYPEVPVLKKPFKLEDVANMVTNILEYKCV